MLLLAAFIFAPRGFGTSPGVTAAYEKLVNEVYIRRDWLRLVEFKDIDGTTIPQIELLPPPEQNLREHAARYAQRSRLTRDVEAFNSGDTGRFAVHAGQLRSIARGLHAIPGPFAGTASWTGRITFAGSPDFKPALRRIADGAMTEVSLVLDPLPGPNPMRSGAALAVFDRAPAAEVRAHSVSLVDGTGRHLGLLFRMGDIPVLRVLEESPDVVLRFAGKLLHKHQFVNLSSPGLLRVEQAVPVARGKRNTSATFEQLTAVDRTWIYLRQPVFRQPLWNEPARTPLAETIADSVERAVAEGSRDVVRDVALTLDPRMEVGVQRELDRICEAIRRRTGGREFRAAVTVMDVPSGELRALASFPGVSHRKGAEGVTRAKNNNFLRLEIGSVAKVPLSAALVRSDPDLLTLQIKRYQRGEFRNILGVAVDPPVTDDHPPNADWIDFEQFVMKSSNKFAATLMTLGATARDRYTERQVSSRVELPPSEHYYLRNSLQTSLPSSFIFDTDIARSAFANPSVHTLPWAKSVGDLFDVNIDSRLTKGAFGTYVWRMAPELLNMPSTRRERILTAFEGSAPEVENLKLDTVRQFRSEYLSQVFGGGESRWSNIKLAEAFSRIVTGRRIQATLLPMRADPPSLEMQPDVRQRLASALTLVAANAPQRGTAARLSRSLQELNARASERGLVLAAFSKTGTLEVPIVIPAVEARAIEQLAKRRIIARHPTKNVLTFNGQTVTRESIEALARSAAGLTVKELPSLSVRSVLNRLATYNEAPDDIKHLILDVDGNVIQDSRVAITTRTRRMKAYVIVLGVYDKSAQLQAPARWPGNHPLVDVTVQPRRAVAIAINIQHTVKGGDELDDAAVYLAQRLLQGPMRNVLFEQATK